MPDPTILRLEPTDGPEMAPVSVRPDRPAELGRAVESSVCLLHDAVSRRHCTVAGHGGRWLVTDLGSRHGTFVNGVRLEPRRPAALAEGDRLRVGPWTFAVRIGDTSLTAARPTGVTIVEAVPSTERVERIPARELASLAQRRLDLLIECSATINTVPDEQSLIAPILDAAIAGSGYRRAAWIRPAGSSERVEVLGFRAGPNETPPSAGAPAFQFSRSLLKEAAQGQPVRLASDGPVRDAHSISQLGIHSALCAPVFVGPSVAAYLYLDARGQENRVHPEAAGFCQALARIAGLACANLNRARLENRHREMEAQFASARQAQQLITPEATGLHGSFRHAIRTRPGMYVAGDLVDLVPLDDGRLAACIGDVTGEGIGAGILMATTQAFLHAALLQHGTAADAVAAANRYVVTHSSLNRFVTMWAGVLDSVRRTLTYVDAGHGYWLLRRGGGAPQTHAGERGIPIGIDPGSAYSGVTIPFEPGDRLVLFSDGLVEQTNSAGEEFGRGRIAQMLARARTPEEDVTALFEAVEAFAGTDALTDDATAASVEYVA